jgi:hypothetical protein
VPSVPHFIIILGATTTTPTIIIDIIIIIVIIEKNKSCYFFLVCSFIHSSCSATPFGPNIPASALFFNTLNVRGQVSHPSS